MTIYLDTKLEYLESAGLLTKKALSALYRKGVRTIGEIIERRKVGWINHLNFSQSELECIQLFLDKIDGGELTLFSSRYYENKAYENISKLQGDVAQFVRELFPGAWRMGDAILNRKYNVLTVHRDLGLTGNVELRHLLLHYLKVMRTYILAQGLYDKRVLSIVEKLIKDLELNIYTFDNDVVLNELLSSRQRLRLFHLFDTLTSKLSAEASVFQHKYLPSFSDAMELFGLPEALIADRYPHVLKGSILHEVWEMVQELEDVFAEEKYSWESIRLQERVKQSFPWLPTADRRFVYRFHLDNDAMPLFYVLFQMLQNATDKPLEIFAQVSGIKDGVRHTLEEVGLQKELTRERVRQLLYQGRSISKTTIEKYLNLGDYDTLFDSNFITSLSSKYRMIQEEERLPQNFLIFCALLSVMGDFEVIHIGEKIVAINSRISPYVNVTNIRNQLMEVSKKKYSEDTIFDLHSLVADVPVDLREDVFWIVCRVAQTYSDIPFDEDWKVAIKQNYIDVAEEVYKILKANGQPMSLEAIFTQFKQRYPNSKYTEPGQLKTGIFKHKNIKHIGKTGTYGLDTWQHVFYGNIRDLLRQTLEASPNPMHIDKLAAIAKKHFPTTNAKSIYASMTQDEASDFVAFQGAFFGLSSKTYSPKYKTVEEERRYVFEERLDMLIQFITTYHRFPFRSGGDAEQSMRRWLYYVENDLAVLTDSQKNSLKAALQPFRDAHLPENEIEERFLETCEQYRAYIENEYELPTRRGNTELYDWMMHSKKNFNSYIDNRRYYLAELFNYIYSLGFSI